MSLRSYIFIKNWNLHYFVYILTNARQETFLTFKYCLTYIHLLFLTGFTILYFSSLHTNHGRLLTSTGSELKVRLTFKKFTKKQVASNVAHS